MCEFAKTAKSKKYQSKYLSTWPARKCDHLDLEIDDTRIKYLNFDQLEKLVSFPTLLFNVTGGANSLDRSLDNKSSNGEPKKYDTELDSNFICLDFQK